MSSVTSRLRIVAPRRGPVDLTDDLCRLVEHSGIAEGCAVVFCAHTTCTLLVNEWEDGALEDFRYRLSHLVPEGSYYAHDDLGRRTQNLVDGERRNGHAHVAQMLIGGSSHAIPVSEGLPLLGRWQRLILLELDEPRERTVLVHIFGEPAGSERGDQAAARLTMER
ncbi:MAG: secondary thiamine-phosphate synthase enzyme YjbQ [Actinomycetota bacterium]